MCLWNISFQFCAADVRGHVTRPEHLYPVAAGRGHGAYAPRRQQRGTPKTSVVIFSQDEVYKNSVSSIEAAMGMEGQIMCLEQCTF